MLTKDVTENKEMKVEVQERLKYDNDIFFKFALGTEDEDAAFIRNTIIAVSYTHLDVYKRQVYDSYESETVTLCTREGC